MDHWTMVVWILSKDANHSNDAIFFIRHVFGSKKHYEEPDGRIVGRVTYYK
jgi:hypothetical protein